MVSSSNTSITFFFWELMLLFVVLYFFLSLNITRSVFKFQFRSFTSNTHVFQYPLKMSETNRNIKFFCKTVCQRPQTPSVSDVTKDIGIVEKYRKHNLSILICYAGFCHYLFSLFLAHRFPSGCMLISIFELTWYSHHVPLQCPQKSYRYSYGVLLVICDNISCLWWYFSSLSVCYSFMLLWDWVWC